MYPYYTMLHPYNTFATSLSNHVTPLWNFCRILIIPCFTLVTLLWHPCNNFTASLFHHLHCGILSCGILFGYHWNKLKWILLHVRNPRIFSVVSFQLILCSFISVECALLSYETRLKTNTGEDNLHVSVKYLILNFHSAD